MLLFHITFRKDGKIIKITRVLILMALINIYSKYRNY